MQLHAMTCGWIETALGTFLAGEAGRIRVPVPCFLIDHPQGLVLFDSGMHPQTQGDATGRLGPLTGAFSIEFAPGEEVSAQLAQRGIDAARVRYLINSHLHFDHCGGNALIPNAELIVQRREWAAGHEADQIARQYYLPIDYQLGHAVRVIDGAHDLFGDGRVVCLPTHGHTAGHQSLQLRLASGDVVLTGDACYLRRTLETSHLPPFADDHDAMRRSIAALRALRDAGARIIVGHDPQEWAQVPALLQ